MQNSFSPLALAAAFATASTAHAAHAGAREGVPPGGDAGDWHLNGPHLGGPHANDESSLKIDQVLLSGVV